MQSFKEFILERIYWGNEAVGFLVFADDTERLLTLLRSSRVNEPLTWSITVSGKVDQGETPIEAAKRELLEETKYKGKINSIKKFDIFKDESDDGSEFTFTSYIIHVPKEFIPILNKEHNKAFWWDGKEPIDGKLHFGTKRLLKKLLKQDSI